MEYINFKWGYCRNHTKYYIYPLHPIHIKYMFTHIFCILTDYNEEMKLVKRGGLCYESSNLSREKLNKC